MQRSEISLLQTWAGYVLSTYRTAWRLLTRRRDRAAPWVLNNEAPKIEA